MSDETTQLEVNNADLNSDNKEAGDDEKFVPSRRLREDKKKIKEEYEAKLSEKDANTEQLKANYEERIKSLEYESLLNKYGEDVINDEKVREVREKHATLSWDEVIVLAGKNKTNKVPEAPRVIGRNPVEFLSEKKEVHWSDVSKLDKAERLDILKKSKTGEVKIVN
jgi:hypothetical protein